MLAVYENDHADRRPQLGISVCASSSPLRAEAVSVANAECLSPPIRSPLYAPYHGVYSSHAGLYPGTRNDTWDT